MAPESGVVARHPTSWKSSYCVRVLLYNDLDATAIPGFAKVRAALEADDFASADVRKVGL